MKLMFFNVVHRQKKIKYYQSFKIQELCKDLNITKLYNSNSMRKIKLYQGWHKMELHYLKFYPMQNLKRNLKENSKESKKNRLMLKL